MIGELLADTAKRKMNYRNIKQYFGLKFIKYVINYGGELDRDTQFEDLKLDDNQANALAALETLQNKLRLTYIVQGGFGDGFEMGIGQLSSSELNSLRMSCGGSFPSIEQGDPILECLSELMIHIYPKLLIKSRAIHSQHSSPLDIEGFRLPKNKYALIKSDILNNLTNGKDGLDHAFCFKLSNGSLVSLQVAVFFDTLVRRAFQNSCSRMKYEINECLNELKLLLESLRDLADGKTVAVSYFVGLRGIYLQDSVKSADGKLLIHPLDSLDNPSLHSQRLASTHTVEPGDQILLGAIACITLPLKVVGSGKDNYSCHRIGDETVSLFLKKINLSLFFTTEQTRGAVASFYESGFALDSPGNYGHGNENSPGVSIIRNDKIKLFSLWLKRLDDSLYGNFKIAFDRLNLILTERHNSVDAVIDGFIAWESLFGGSGESILRICGSIAKLLDPKDKAEFYKKLREVYGQRSNIVHGGKSKLLHNQSKLAETKEFVCTVARKCLVKLIEEKPDLIKLDPSARSNKILLDI